MLIAGTLLVLLFGLWLAELAAAMTRFGGIRWSRDLVQINLAWFALLVGGVLLLVMAARLFARASQLRAKQQRDEFV
jgi:hypothetical protein